MWKRIVVGLALLLGEGRARALDNLYAVSEVGGGLAGAGLGLAASRHFDGEDGWGWSKTDTAMELVLVGVTLIDLMQTSDFRAYGYEENNPLLGRRPSQQEVTLGIIGMVVGHALVAWALPKPWRSIWQGGAIGMEVSAVVSNRAMGVGLRMPW